MCLKGREAVFFRRFLGRSPYTQVRTFLVIYIYSKLTFAPYVA